MQRPLRASPRMVPTIGASSSVSHWTLLSERLMSESREKWEGKEATTSTVRRRIAILFWTMNEGVAGNAHTWELDPMWDDWHSYTLKLCEEHAMAWSHWISRPRSASC